MSLPRLLAIARKESLHLLRDWRSLVLALAIPLLLIMLYGYALTLDLRRVPTVVWDQSGSPASRELLSLFASSPYFSLQSYHHNYQELEEEIAAARAMIAVVIPADFAGKVAANQPVQIQLIGDGSDANTSRLALNYAEAVSAIYARNITSAMLQQQGRGELKPPLSMEMRAWYNADLRSQNVLVPGIIALVMIVVAALLTSTTVAREWESGTMEQLIATPLKVPELIFGKVLPYFAIGMIDVTTAVLLGKYMFAVPMVGNAALLFACSAIFLAGALFFGLTLSIALKSQVLANQLAIIAGFLPTLILSGFVFAIENMPQPLQFLTYIVPARYFIAILRGIYLKGIGLEILWVNVVFLLIYALLMLLLAHRKLKFELE